MRKNKVNFFLAVKLLRLLRLASLKISLKVGLMANLMVGVAISIMLVSCASDTTGSGGNNTPNPPNDPNTPKVFGVVNVANVSDNSITDSLELIGASAVATAQIGGTAYLFVAGNIDKGISVFSIASDGSLNNVYNLSDDGTLNLDAPFSLSTANLGGATYLFSTSGPFNGVGDGLSVFEVVDNGIGNISLRNVTNVSDNPSLRISSSKFSTITRVGNTNYLLVSGESDNGISVFSVADDGSLANVYNVGDNSTLNLNLIDDIAIAEVGNTNYIFAVGFNDNGISVFSINNDGSLVNVFNINDNSNLELGGSSGVASARVGNTNYLFASGFNDHGISVFSINDNGSLNNTTNLIHDKGFSLFQPAFLTTVEVDGTSYLLSTSKIGRLNVISIAEDGVLANVTNIIDDTTLNLNRAGPVATTEVGGNTYIFVVGEGDHGVSVFRIGLQ